MKWYLRTEAIDGCEAANQKYKRKKKVMVRQ